MPGSENFDLFCGTNLLENFGGRGRNSSGHHCISGISNIVYYM